MINSFYIQKEVAKVFHMIEMQNFFLFDIFNKACRKNVGCYEREIYFPMIIPTSLSLY